MCNGKKLARIVSGVNQDIYDTKIAPLINGKYKSEYGMYRDILYTNSPLKHEQYAFDNCRKGNNCTNINIIDGKLYMCPIASNIKYFNKFFNKDCKIERKDYLKIKEIKNIEEINQFISKPTPFCRYCNIEKRTFDNKWEVTQRKIEEWI